MVTAFHKAGVQVEVANIVIGGSEAEENACEVIFIQLSASVATTFDAHS